MPCLPKDHEPTVSLPFPTRARQRRLNLKSSLQEVKAECRQIRNEWSCEEEGRRRRLADAMQVQLLDVLTS